MTAFRMVIVLLPLTLTSFILNCRGTTDQTNRLDAASTLSAPGSTDSEIDPDDPIEDSKDDPFLTDLEPITNEPDGDYSEDMSSDPQIMDLALTPKKYIEKRPRKPRKFAGATVLAAMRRMRRYYYTVPFMANSESNSVEVTLPSARGIALKDYQKLTEIGVNDVDLKTPIDDFALVWNSDGVGTDGNNLAVMPVFWSDLQSHFYPIPPHRRHGCWTMALYSLAADSARAVKPEEIRRHVRDICTGVVQIDKTKLAQDKLMENAIGAIPVQLSAYNLMWVDPVRRGFIKLPEDIRMSPDSARLGSPASDFKVVEHPEEVQNLEAVKWAAAQREKGYVNVWDYIMLSQLYAFDWEQQQAVINAYYGDHKRYSGRRGKFNPGNGKDCALWRGRLGHDPRDGTHCSPDKKLWEAMLSAGR